MGPRAHILSHSLWSFSRKRHKEGAKNGEKGIKGIKKKERQGKTGTTYERSMTSTSLLVSIVHTCRKEPMTSSKEADVYKKMV